MSEIAIILALIGINGILSMTEMALVSVRKSALSHEANKGSASAKAALNLANEPDRFLSTIQIGITVVGILTGLCSGKMLADDFAKVLLVLGLPQGFAHGLGQALIVVVVTYLTIVFGELLPKRIGLNASLKTAKIMAKPMIFLARLAMPFVWLLSKSTTTLFRLLGIKPKSEKITEEEIKSIIRESTKDGEVQEVEHDIMERVFLLGDLRVSSLMTHRTDLICIDINMSFEQVKQCIETNLFTVYPVIDKSLDNVLGMVTLKTLIFQMDQSRFDLNSLLVTPTYFHENMSVYKALERMQSHKISQALICDEFGACQGLISLKDILSALVGSVDHSSEEPQILARDDGRTWLIEGQCPLYEFLSYFDGEHLYSNANNFQTLAGMILSTLEHIPKTGETLQWKGFHFEIIDMDGARIDKVLLTQKP